MSLGLDRMFCLSLGPLFSHDLQCLAEIQHTTITNIHLLSFAPFFLLLYSRSFFLSRTLPFFDVVMNWEARLNSIELISLEKLLFGIDIETSENSKQV